MITLFPLRAKCGMCEVHIGTSRAWYSEDIGSVRQEFLRWHKHKVDWTIRREKPSCVLLMAIGVQYSLLDVARPCIPHLQQFVECSLSQRQCVFHLDKT